jgi:eukaryotic-like serine/threonine-protein kinase
MKFEHCWEVVGCGREPGGRQAGELGVCPASLSGALGGGNRGAARGRSCWAFPGTPCHLWIEGKPGDQPVPCAQCELMQQVCEQEGRYFALRPPPQTRLDGAA